MLVRRSVQLPLSADRAWELLQEWNTFLYVTRGVLAFELEDPPPVRFQPGQVHRGRLWLAHVLPGWRHELKVIAVDPKKREIHTNESGGLLRVWNHGLIVRPLSADTCVYTDEVELDAGWLSLPAWLVTHAVFRYRQARWRRLARQLG